MFTKRVELGSGWADVYTVRSHGMANRIERALRATDEDFRGEVILTMTAGWLLVSVFDGIPVEHTLEGLTGVDEGVVSKLFDAAVAAWTEASADEKVPPPSAATSDDSLPVSPSPSPIPTSETPSSS